MYIVTRLKKLKAKANGSEEIKEEEREGIDYDIIKYFEKEDEAVKEGQRLWKQSPHSTYLVFTLQHVFKFKDTPMEHINLLDT